MGSDLYMKAQEMEPAFHLARLVKKKVEELKFELETGTEVVRVEDLLQWLDDYDPVWNYNDYR